MAERRFDAELLARNLSLSYGVTPAATINWDIGAWRGPRVLVPVVVEAIAVSPADAAKPWAAVAVDPLNPQAPRPAPFDTHTQREPGIHLHWALPDGLTRGERAAAPADAPMPASAQPTTEQGETRDARRTEFTAMPDRWLVVRIQAGNTPTAPKTATAWVVASALDPARRRAVPLHQWREDRSEPAEPVTAMGPGEPTFAVYYDNTRNLLAFHDPLTGVGPGPFTYLVCGWYRDLESDPLHAPATESAWYATLKRLGWSLNNAATVELDRAAREAARLLSQTGLASAKTSDDSGFTSKEDSEPVRLGSGATKFLKVKPAASTSQASKASKSTPYVLARQRYFQQHWPRQLLCHGALFDVAWAGRGGGFDVPDAGPPAAGQVSVAVGNTGAQALSALCASAGGDAGLARLVDAFSTGALADLGQPSGLARLEDLLHAEDFATRPGGFVLDQIEQGDLFPPASGSESPPVPGSTRREPESPLVKGLNKGFKEMAQPARKFFRADASMHELMAGLPGSSSQKADAAPQARPRTLETVRRAMPRWFEPRDPVVMLQQARRGYKHGEDGALQADGTLRCRVTGETIDELGVNPWAAVEPGVTNHALVAVRGADLSTADLRSGQIPAECGALFFEALLLDPTTVTVARDVIVKRANAAFKAQAQINRPRANPVVPLARAGQRYQAEQSMLLAAVLNPALDLQALATASNLQGTMPSKLALQFWRRPWTPIELAWEVDWFPSPQAERDWTLGTTDFALLAPPADAVAATPALTLQGRSLLTPAVARTLERQVQRFLKDEADGNSDDATPADEADLAALVQRLQQLDVLGASFGGLHDLLMARRAVPGLGADPSPDAWQAVPEASALWLLRAGHLKLKRLRVIDAFGQFHDVAQARLDAPIRADDLQSPVGPAWLAMPPRLQEPARLMFRLLDASAGANDAREATRAHTPVCGWLVPDHMDEAVEVFDGQGQSLGQLQPAEDGRTLEWQGVPGQQAPLGAPPQIAQPQTAGFVQGLLDWARQDPTLAASATPPSETALSALLRMIDATLWSTDPVGRAGNEHLSLLVGHPMALVRAELRLEVQSDPQATAQQPGLYPTARQELERTPLPVRLGELLALDDGLMGYFVNDDYGRFYPVHESLAPQARPVGPGEGYLNSMAAAPDTATRPVEHPYIDRSPLVSIRPGQRLLLTLLLDPRGAVHATCGVLPRKKIELMREHVNPALEALTYTFRIGPVLTDADAVRMPLPAEITGGWSWVRRVNVTTWQEDPVVKATQDALLPDAPAMLSEGWLKLSGANKPATPAA